MSALDRQSGGPGAAQPPMACLLHDSARRAIEGAGKRLGLDTGRTQSVCWSKEVRRDKVADGRSDLQ
ncbi:hypothetical protein NDU88_002635 [Pleurodeles waltl]|uniref:Uncharacterized protein n=1 Tax=Pleurodeles waltl TaxID=8319 RepID=A0AAV7LEQ4_PLEWA|nr:hypothetical protein NDU88_002635 [Pleurodeles waltl]